MSETSHPTKQELEAAYFHGLRHMGGIDPEVARDLGYDVTPEDFQASIEQPLPVVIDDPELNKLWHQEQAEKRRSVGPSAGKLTIKQAQKNAARHVAQHRQRRGDERKINRDNQ